MASQSLENNSIANWNQPIQSRIERAEYYFETILKNQREWYSKKAGRQKNWHLFYAITVILLGAVITCLQAVDTAEVWVRYLTAGLGAAVAVTQGLDTLLQPGETWQGYRKASESMKREYRLYVNGADAYADATDETTAYRVFVTRVETVIAEEQQLFWQVHVKTFEQQSVSKPDNDMPNV